MTGCIVDTFQQNISDEDLVVGGFQVIVNGGHDSLDGVGGGDGHEFEPLVVEGIVEGEGEVDVGLFPGESFYAGDDADGGEGEAAGTKAAQGFVGKRFDGCESVVGVGQGLTHAHEDDRVDGEVVFDKVEDLVENFIGGEILFEADGPGGAEETAEGAAGLGRNTEGVVDFTDPTLLEAIAQANGFNLVMVRGGKQNFLGLVTLDLMDFGEG